VSEGRFCERTGALPVSKLCVFFISTFHPTTALRERKKSEKDSSQKERLEPIIQTLKKQLEARQ
jgi:hypothetical protein